MCPALNRLVKRMTIGGGDRGQNLRQGLRSTQLWGARLRLTFPVPVSGWGWAVRFEQGARGRVVEGALAALAVAGRGLVATGYLEGAPKQRTIFPLALD